MRPWWIAAVVLLAVQPQPPFRSGAQIVEVDVRVSKDGKFVADLTQPDFEILEDGVPQKIVSVTLVSTSAPLAPAAPPAPLAPPAPHAPQFWLFVFDTNHLSAGGLTRTRDAVVKFIGERFQKGDVGGVVAEGKMANNRLTTDVEELKTAVAAVKLPGELRSRQLELREWPRIQDDAEAWAIANGDRTALQAATIRACNEDVDACKRAPVDTQLQEKARRLTASTRTATTVTLKAMEALGNGLARIVGPKTVVFLSEGFFLQSQDAELRQAAGMITRAGARVYSVDARGLNRGGASSDIIDQPVVQQAFGAAQRFDTQTDGTNSLAIDTGGFAIRNENNIGRALDQIQADAGTYYVIGYTPANTAYDGKYRAIDVRVARAGVKVRARRGYLALEPAALLRPKGAESAAVAPKRDSEETRAKADTSAHEALPSRQIETLDAVRTLRESAFARLAPGASFGEPGSAARSAAELGWSAYEKGDVDTAAKHLEAAAKDANARPWVLYALGFAQYAQRRYKDAAVSWERVRAAAPDFEPVYFNLADAYGVQSEAGTAIGVLREAEGRWAADPEVSNAIGVIQVRRGALDAAIASFERATAIAPADALGYFNLGRTLQMRWQKMQRFDRERERWIGPEDDRRKAIAALEKYVALGGPYVPQAKGALAALAWR